MLKKIFLENIFQVITEIYNKVFGDCPWTPSIPLIRNQNAKSLLSIGNVDIDITKLQTKGKNTNLYLLGTQLQLLEKLAACAISNWLVLLVGPPHVGKRSAVKALAEMFGQEIRSMRLTSGTDALDLLGSFEQVSLKLKGNSSSKVFSDCC